MSAHIREHRITQAMSVSTIFGVHAKTGNILIFDEHENELQLFTAKKPEEILLRSSMKFQPLLYQLDADSCENWWLRFIDRVVVLNRRLDKVIFEISLCGKDQAVFCMNRTRELIFVGYLKEKIMVVETYRAAPGTVKKIKSTTVNICNEEEMCDNKRYLHLSQCEQFSNAFYANTVEGSRQYLYVFREQDQKSRVIVKIYIPEGNCIELL